MDTRGPGSGRRRSSSTLRRHIPAEDWYGLLAVLQEEYHSICERHLPDAYRVLMKEPTFGIDEARDHWGVWSDVYSEVHIARFHAEEDSLPTVLETLRHETAHQLVSVTHAFGGEGDDDSHGPAFHKGFAMLGGVCDAESTVPRRGWCFAGVQDRREAMAAKLSEQDGASSEREARRLSEKCGRRVVPDGCRKDLCVVYLGRPRFRIPRYLRRLALLLGLQGGVGRLWVPWRGPRRGFTARRLAINGTRKQLIAACDVLDEFEECKRGFRVQLGEGLAYGYWPPIPAEHLRALDAAVDILFCDYGFDGV